MRRHLWNGQSKVTYELHNAPPFTLIPGLGKELWTLCLSTKELAEEGPYKLAMSFPEGDCNIFLSKGPAWLTRHGFKTASKYSPKVVRFDTVEYQFVTPHLKVYKAV